MPLPVLGLAAWKPAEQVFSGIGHALGFGGKTDEEKAQIRVGRAAQLLDCAQRGDVAAARTVLAEQTYSSQPEGRQAYSDAWQRLQVSRPDVALEAQRAGPLRDSTSSGACSRFELGSIPGMGNQTTAPRGAVSSGSSSGSAGLIVAGVGVLAALALFN